MLVGSLFLRQPPPCIPLPPGCAARCILFIFGQGCLQPQMTLVWSHSGSHGDAPESFPGLPMDQRWEPAVSAQEVLANGAGGIGLCFSSQTQVAPEKL